MGAVWVASAQTVELSEVTFRAAAEVHRGGKARVEQGHGLPVGRLLAGLGGKLGLAETFDFVAGQLRLLVGVVLAHLGVAVALDDLDVLAGAGPGRTSLADLGNVGDHHRVHGLTVGKLFASLGLDLLAGQGLGGCGRSSISPLVSCRVRRPAAAWRTAPYLCDSYPRGSGGEQAVPSTPPGHGVGHLVREWIAYERPASPRVHRQCR